MSENSKAVIANLERYIIAFPLILLLFTGQLERSNDHYQLLDYENNKNMRMLFGLTVGCAVILLIPILLAVTDFALRVFTWGVFFCLPIAVLFWQVLAYYNCHLDYTEAKIVTAKVFLKDYNHGRGPTKYTLVLVNKAYDSRALRLVVTESFYRTVAIGNQIRLSIKDGAFGYKWIYLYEKVS